jgi:hypothetical protein
MRPAFPPSPLKFRTAGFPGHGFKVGLSDAAFPARWFAIAFRSLGPSGIPRTVSGTDVLMNTSVQADFRSTPGALAPVLVMLSRSILT